MDILKRCKLIFNKYGSLSAAVEISKFLKIIPIFKSEKADKYSESIEFPFSLSRDHPERQSAVTRATCVIFICYQVYLFRCRPGFLKK